MDLRWTCQKFDELNSRDLYRILKLRAEVFIVEQDCVYQDIDDLDQQALHVTGNVKSENAEPELVCYTRLLPPGARYDTPAISRVLSKKTVRGEGGGKILMVQSIAYCREYWPGEVITISAQQYLEKFYTELGFTTESKPYDEDGIPHIKMKHRKHRKNS